MFYKYLSQESILRPLQTSGGSFELFRSNDCIETQLPPQTLHLVDQRRQRLRQDTMRCFTFSKRPFHTAPFCGRESGSHWESPWKHSRGNPQLNVFKAFRTHRRLRWIEGKDGFEESGEQNSELRFAGFFHTYGYYVLLNLWVRCFNLWVPIFLSCYQSSLINFRISLASLGTFFSQGLIET